MSFSVDWDEADPAILITIIDEGWTWREFFIESSQREAQLMDAVEHPVYQISIIKGGIPIFPRGWSAFMNESANMNHPNFAGGVIVTPLKGAQALKRVFFRLFPRYVGKVDIVPTIQDAYQYIEKLRSVSQPEA